MDSESEGARIVSKLHSQLACYHRSLCIVQCTRMPPGRRMTPSDLGGSRSGTEGLLVGISYLPAFTGPTTDADEPD